MKEINVPFADTISKQIYMNLQSLIESNDLSYLMKVHEICGIVSDKTYEQYIYLLSKKKEGKKLILYGLGERLRYWYEFAKKNKDAPGYAFFPFVSDIPWDGYCDKYADKFVNGFFGEGQKVMNLEEIIPIKDESVICVAAPAYYPEILSEMKLLGIHEQSIMLLQFPHLKDYDEKQYVEDFLEKSTEGIIIDGGCYRCDSIEKFVSWTEGRYGRIISFEPDPSNYSICKEIEMARKWPNVEIICAGLSNKDSICKMYANGNAGSYIADDGEREIIVRSIDSVISENENVTFIKLDVEGAELETLMGAEKTILRCHPRLAVCIYHKISDLHDITTYIMNLSSDYKFYYRIYSNSFFEVTLYAV